MLVSHLCCLPWLLSALGLCKLNRAECLHCRMKSCDLKWLADSLAVNRVNKAKKRQCGGAAGPQTQSGRVFRKPYLICYTRASKQADLACDMQKPPWPCSLQACFNILAESTTVGKMRGKGSRKPMQKETEKSMVGKEDKPEKSTWNLVDQMAIPKHLG